MKHHDVIVLVALVVFVVGGFWLGLRGSARHQRSIYHYRKGRQDL